MIVAGIGFNTSATPAALGKAVSAAMATAGVSKLDAMATATAKSQDATLTAFAAAQSLPLVAVDVAGIKTPSQSPRVQAMFHTGSLAEAAALIAAGPQARLLAPVTKSPCGRATCAIAISEPSP